MNILGLRNLIVQAHGSIFFEIRHIALLQGEHKPTTRNKRWILLNRSSQPLRNSNTHFVFLQEIVSGKPKAMYM